MCQIVVALLYVLFSYITNKYLISQGIVSAVWLGSGVAFAALLIGGWRYLWGAFFGMLAFNVLAHNSFIGVVGVTLANVIEVTFGFWLLSKKGVVSQSALQNYLSQILFCGGVASIVGGVIGTLTLLVLGFITSADYLKNVLTWWMGDTLGVVLLVPFALIWHEKKLTEIQGKQWLEGILLVSATFLTGQIIFLNWLSEFLSNAPKGYVMFFCVSIVAIRMGMRGATLVILITATQSMLSAYLRIGYFANEIAISELRNYWLYMLILSGVGVSLASYVNKVNLTMRQLRVEMADRIHAVLAKQEATERLHKIANQLPNVVFQFQMRPDGSFCIPYVNETLLDIYRLCPEDVYEDANPMFAVTHPADLADHIEKIKISARDLSPWNDEYRLKFADGKECWLASNARPQREEDGSTLWHGFVIDITERKQVEAALKKESDKSLALLRNASDGIHILNSDGNVIECSDSFCTMLGYSREEAIGMHVSQWDAEIPQNEIMNIVHAQFEKTTRHQFESRHRRKDGTIYDVELSGCPIEFDGEWVLFNSARDITARKRTEKNLYYAKKDLENILSAATEVCIISTDKNGLITVFNRGAELMLGYTADEMVEKQTPAIVHDMNEVEQRGRELSLELDRPISGFNIFVEKANQFGNETREWTFIHKNKSRLTVSLTVTTIRNENGEITGYLGIANDITEKKQIERNLQASEKRLNEIIDLMPVAVFVKDAQSRMTIMNKACENQWGIRLSELQNTTGSHIFPPEQMEVFLAMDKKVFVDGKTFELEEFLWNATLQENRVTHTYKKPVFNERGEPDYLIGISIDVTEDKRKEQLLLASEARFRTIIDISPVPMALNDDQQNITFLNHAFLETFGYDLEDIPKLEIWWEKAYPDLDYRKWIAETWQTTLEQAKREQKAFVPFEINVCCKNGSQKVVLVSTAMVSETSNNLHLVVLYDITERKQVEQELRDSEQRLNLSQEYGGIGSWEADLINGNNIWSNSLFQLVKLPVSEKVTWNDFLAIVHPDDRQKVIDAKQMHLVHKAKYDVEYRVIIADGEIRWMRSAGRAQFSDDETPIRFIGIAQDVTERHILESELKRSNADLEQFAYAVSHDMRQPLRMVTSYLSLIETALATQLDDDTRQFLTFAVEGAKRMDSMILSLLDYSRVGRQTETFSVISSRAAIDEAISFLRPALETSGGKIEIFGDWVDLVASHDELTRLFQNLIGNALKYHDENKFPRVEVSATFTENRFRVEVRDNGIGINSNQIDRLFKVFSRLQARSRFEGTGVGLALCRKIVEHHGGEIGVKSEGEGQGCIFWFELPLDN